MIQEVVTIDLPVGEKLRIKKQHLENGGKDKKRISIVTGIHGDELEGQYVCYDIIRRIKAHMEDLTGVVDVYPALNPLGIDSISRSIPLFDLDMNRIFPGSNDGPLAEYTAGRIIRDIRGSDICVDIHASNIYLKEIPQVRINELMADTLLPYAKKLNVDFIWIHQSATVLESTLAHSLNTIGIPTLVVEMGVGMRLTRQYCDQLVDGIFNLMHEAGVWQGETAPVKEAKVSADPDEVFFANANETGLFIPQIAHGKEIETGAALGEIVDPFSGEVVETITSPAGGMVFTIREYPIVYEGSLVARVLSKKT